MEGGWSKVEDLEREEWGEQGSKPRQDGWGL